MREHLLLTSKQAAELIGYSHLTVRNWRQGKKTWEPGLRGPKFHSIHGRIVYKRADVLEWLARFGQYYDEPKHTSMYASEL